MILNLDKTIVANYSSQAQKARVLTENWVDQEIYCPNCGCVKIEKYPNNQPVGDFYCSNCQEEYELKSKQSAFTLKIVDGAYRTMLERLSNSNNPNLFLLTYNFNTSAISNFLVVPKQFFIPDIIEKRKPLALTARRAGWVGCNILLNQIPEAGKIFVVLDGRIEPKEKVLSRWQKTLFLREEKEISARGWTLDVMRCVEKLNKKDFTLDDVYAFERELSLKHPENKHIKDKIRQQLQILRDKGYLDFVSRGYYRFSN